MFRKCGKGSASKQTASTLASVQITPGTKRRRIGANLPLHQWRRRDNSPASPSTVQIDGVPGPAKPCSDEYPLKPERPIRARCLNGGLASSVAAVHTLAYCSARCVSVAQDVAVGATHAPGKRARVARPSATNTLPSPWRRSSVMVKAGRLRRAYSPADGAPRDCGRLLRHFASRRASKLFSHGWVPAFGDRTVGR